MSHGKQLLAVICLLCYQQGLECMKHKIARPHPSLSESGSTSILKGVGRFGRTADRITQDSGEEARSRKLMDDGDRPGSVNCITNRMKKNGHAPLLRSRLLQELIHPNMLQVNVTVQYNETLTAASKLVAIRPGLSVLGAIREAALDFLHDNPDQTNYFNIRYARSLRHRCDVIVMAMTTPNKAYRRWIVLVENNSGQTIYRGPCLYSRRRLLIFPGYKIVLKYVA